jgi:uncharacterized protein
MPDFLGRGPRFPLIGKLPDDRGDMAKGHEPGDMAKGPFLSWSDGENKVRQSIRLILSTAPGERVMRPDFGCGIHDLVFEPATPALNALLVDRVKTALARWEPRIDVLSVEVQQGASKQHQLLLDITYRVRANNSVHNMVYPFYLLEGAA